MLDLTRHPKLLRFMWVVDKGVAVLQRHIVGSRDMARQLSDFYEEMWREAAHALSAEIEPLGQDVFEIRRGAARTRVKQNNTALDNLATHGIVRTKPVILALLTRNGLPVPRHLTFDVGDMRPAVAFLERLGCECVIKPASGSGGSGVTTGIRSRWQLARAAFGAAASGCEVLIEEQVEGANYRLLYLDGELLDVVWRRPPSTAADGRSSVRQLVAQVNRERLSRQQFSHDLLTIDLDMKSTLARQGYSLASVPSAGTVVILKTAINQNCIADNVSAPDTLCRPILEAGARAATLAGARLAGVDIITREPCLPLEQSGGVILEVNTPPGLFWHYHKGDDAIRLGVHVLKRLLVDAKSGDASPDQPRVSVPVDVK